MLTPESSLVHCVLWLLKRVNSPKLGRFGCCPKHDQLLQMSKSLKWMSQTMPCDPLWSPFGAWQCPDCMCTFSSDLWCCVFCGFSR